MIFVSIFSFLCAHFRPHSRASPTARIDFEDGYLTRLGNDSGTTRQLRNEGCSTNENYVGIGQRKFAQSSGFICGTGQEYRKAFGIRVSAVVIVNSNQTLVENAACFLQRKTSFARGVR